MKRLITLFIAFLLFFNKSTSQIQQLEFEHLTMKDGLSQSSVTCILQDKYGFMWFGTEDGLNKYDGNKFITYRHNDDDENSIRDNIIQSIIEDENGIIWIGTFNGGLNNYNQISEKFKNFSHDPQNGNSLSHNTVNSVVQDANGFLWIGTNGGGLNKFEKSTNNFIHYKNDPNNNKSLSSNKIRVVYMDKSGNIWIGTEDNGLNLYVSEKDEFISYQQDPNDPNSLSHNSVYSIFEDEDGMLWIGTDGGGLNMFDQVKNKFYHFKHLHNNPVSLSSNRIRQIYEDKDHKLWILTYGGGLNILDRSTLSFKHYREDQFNPYSLGNDKAISIYEDRFENMWIGTEASGINKYSPTKRKFNHFVGLSNNRNSLQGNSIKAFYEDSSGIIWIGTSEGYLNRFNRKTNQFKHFVFHDNRFQIRAICEPKPGTLWIGTDGGGICVFSKENGIQEIITHDEENPGSLSDDRIYTLFKDESDTIWIGTRKGLNKYDVKKNQFISYLNNNDNENSISGNFIYSIYEDHNQVLWIGTISNGLNRFDRKSGIFTQYKNEKGNLSSLSDNIVYSIFEDDKSNLWIGTRKGLNKFDETSNTFSRYTVRDGLPNNVIYATLDDKNGNLWISTNNGLSKFDIGRATFKNYDLNDGLQSMEFNGGAFLKCKNGDLLFGGINGFNLFNSTDIKDNQNEPPVLFTGFYVFNKKIPVGEMEDGRIILNESITTIDKIILTYSDRSFSIEFAALDYVASKKNNFAYMFDGIDKEWIDLGTRNNITFHSLPPNKYHLRVKASNSDGIWNEKGASIIIEIIPPWWETKLFYIILIFLIASIIYGYIKIRERNLKKDKEKLAKIVDDRTKEIQKQNEEITAQAFNLKEINLELEKLSIALSETDNAVVIMDRNTNFEWVNDGFIRLHGYNLETLKKEIGSNLHETSQNKVIRDAVAFCKTTKKATVYENRNVSKSGTTYWTQTTLTPLIDEKGEIQNFIAIDSDISTLKKAEQKIKNQNESIKNSIEYALTIQQALLPFEEDIGKDFEHFIIYRPKDIVSGDFYWYLKKQINNRTFYFMAVVDCTGHGVPGAFMSMIGNRLLYEIVNEKNILHPDEILNHLDNSIRIALNQKKTENDDGMDISLCRFEKKENGHYSLSFSGAKNSLIYYKRAIHEMHLIKANNRSIGGFVHIEKAEFTRKEIDLEKGDRLYLYTDGFLDQNNKEGQKLGFIKFLEILELSTNLSIPMQKSYVEDAFDNHQGNEKQRDDLTLLGISLI